MNMIKKILAAMLSLMLVVALCACGSTGSKPDMGESETPVEDAPAYLEDFMTRMKAQNFDVYDVTHQYEDEEIIGAGRAEKTEIGVSVYLYVMDSEAAASAKAGSFIENFDPDSLVQHDEYTVTAEMNGTQYLVYTDGLCAYLEYAPEGYDLSEMMAFVGAGTSNEEG